MKDYIEKLLFIITICLLMTNVYSAGEGGWSQGAELTGMKMDNPMIYFDHKLITPRWPDCIQILPVTDTGELGEWSGFSPQGLTVYHETSITTTDKYMFVSGGYQEGALLASGRNVAALYQLTLSPDSIGYVVYSGSMNTPRGLHSSLMVNDYLYMFGGTAYGIVTSSFILSSVSYAKFNRTTERLEAFQSGYPFKQIRGPVYSSFRLENKVYCFGPHISDGLVDLLERPYYIESADIQEDGRLGPWTVVGGPYKGFYNPAGAVFTQQSTLFIIDNKHGSNDTINRCWLMDLKDSGVEGKTFKQVTGLTPPLSTLSDIGLGTWGRFVYLLNNYHCLYDPLLTSTTLFEEPTEKK